MTLSESMLEGCERVVLICKAQDMGADYMFQEFTGYACKRDWPIVARAVHITLLVYRSDNGLRPISWYGTAIKGLIEEGCEWGCQDVCELFQYKVW